MFQSRSRSRSRKLPGAGATIVKNGRLRQPCLKTTFTSVFLKEILEICKFSYEPFGDENEKFADSREICTTYSSW